MSKYHRSENQPREPRTKKPYVKPGFQREKVFETMAMACGKMQSTESQCHQNRKNS